MDNGTRRHQVAVLVLMVGCALAAAQTLVTGQAAPPAKPQSTPQSAAPIDLTGNWVSVVTEDWLLRMVTPAKGNYSFVPLNQEGRKTADAWDLAKDRAAGAECRPFGVGGLMRIPGRLRISWQDPRALKIEADAGTQTRLVHFNPSPPPVGPKTWQGWSVAEWDWVNANAPERGGSLKVVTTGMRSGYLRKNGVPYSENMVMTEYFDRHTEPNGDHWFTITTIVEDPKYLTQPFVTTTDFKRESDGSKWNSTKCETVPPIGKGTA